MLKTAFTYKALRLRLFLGLLIILTQAGALAAAQSTTLPVLKPRPPRVERPKPPQVKAPKAPSTAGAAIQAAPLPGGEFLSPELLDRIREDQQGVDFNRLAKVYPSLKTIVLLAFDRELEFDHLIRLHGLEAYPVNGDNVDYLGRTHGIFHTRAGNLGRLKKAAGVKALIPLARFRMRGLYRVHFQIVEPGFSGPLAFSVTAPRDSFGKRLLREASFVYPRNPFRIRVDEAGNRWLETVLEEAGEGGQLKLDFSFIYQVEMAELINHAILMTPLKPSEAVDWADPAAVFLEPGLKITPGSQEVAALAGEILGEERIPRRVWARIAKYIKDNIPYDHQKRAEFFGGRKVYRSMAEMYDPPAVILNKKMGACPETSLLEASLFRAVGIPARTAGRWAHFFTEVYLPGRGWVSTSVTPTGIPLVRDVDAEHLPFVSWDREAAVKTTRWTGDIRIKVRGLP